MTVHKKDYDNEYYEISIYNLPNFEITDVLAFIRYIVAYDKDISNRFPDGVYMEALALDPHNRFFKIHDSIFIDNDTTLEDYEIMVEEFDTGDMLQHLSYNSIKLIFYYN
jgi:hypothetical protein